MSRAETNTDQNPPLRMNTLTTLDTTYKYLFYFANKLFFYMLFLETLQINSLGILMFTILNHEMPKMSWTNSSKYVIVHLCQDTWE